MSYRTLHKSYGLAVLGFAMAIGCEQSANSPSTKTAASSSQPVGKENQKVDQGSEQKDNALAFEGFIVHAPVTHDNLTIFPVSLVKPNLEDRFITLDEGLKKGTIEVFELSGTGSAGRANASGIAEPANPSGIAEPANAGGIQEVAETPADTLQQESPAVENGNDGTSVQAAANDANDVNQLPFQTDSTQILQQSGNSVNQVFVRNKSDRPLYLMPGEIILGGDQDRTIGEEIVIAPSDEPVQVEVFCVEHGRWEGRSAERTVQELTVAVTNSASAQSIAVNLAPANEDGSSDSLNESARQLSQQAEKGQFIASVGVLTKRARVAAQGLKDQGQVWKEVASANASAKSQIASGAFTENYVNEDNIKRFEGFLDALQDRVSGTDNIAGVVVAVNGKIDAADIFESTPLFRKLWPKLLKSYALDAANRSADDDSAEEAMTLSVENLNDEPATTDRQKDTEMELVVCTLQDAIDFLQKAKAANETASNVADGMSISHRSDDSVDSFSLRLSEPSAAAEAGGLGGGGLGGAVHFSGFSK